MYKKILIIGLLLIVTAAIGASLYYAVLARPVQAAAAAESIDQDLEAAIASNPANGDLTGGIGQGDGRGRGNTGSGSSSANGAGGGYRGGRSGGTQGGGQALPAASDLSETEAQSLLFMIEEEKLARDVYQVLFERWGLPEFQTISQSEQNHMNSIQQLLDRYGLSSPVQTSAGSFTDPALRSLYAELVASGSQSLAEALQVGGLIEEIDILDLQNRLTQTDNSDIQQVYNNLLNGSYNHLRAFSTTFSIQTGQTYQPQKLGAEAYQAIQSGSPQRGNGNRQGVSGQGANGGGNGRGRSHGST